MNSYTNQIFYLFERWVEVVEPSLHDGQGGGLVDGRRLRRQDGASVRAVAVDGLDLNKNGCKSKKFVNI